MRKLKNSLTAGSIYLPLMRFMLPIMFAAFLQALYGAVDLIVIGRFLSADPLVIQNATAAVGTGSMIMVLITYIISGLTMGVTVTLGKYIGAEDRSGATKTVNAAIEIFAVFAVVLTAIMEIGAPLFARWMNAPDIDLTVQYVRICSAGLIFITAYNATGGLFRGIGNSVLPLVFVAAASVVNIVLDLLLVCVIPMGVSGVAIATVTAQAVSVILSLLVMRKIPLPFELNLKTIRFHRKETRIILGTGIPLALQDFLTNLSFVIINSVANHLGSDPSAWSAIASGYSVDNKLTTFMMILPMAFLQSMSVFTAQNIGAGKPERIRKGLRYMTFTTLWAGLLLALTCFFGGELLASLFISDHASIQYAAQYLKGFAADMLVGCTVLMLLGYFNGRGHSKFVMLQGLFSAFCIRIPAVLFLSTRSDVTLIHLGLGCAAASYSSLLLCTGFFAFLHRQRTTTISLQYPPEKACIRETQSGYCKKGKSFLKAFYPIKHSMKTELIYFYRSFPTSTPFGRSLAERTESIRFRPFFCLSQYSETKSSNILLLKHSRLPNDEPIKNKAKKRSRPWSLFFFYNLQKTILEGLPDYSAP